MVSSAERFTCPSAARHPRHTDQTEGTVELAGDLLGNERLERTEQCAFFRFYGILPALRDRADDRKRLLHHFGSRVIGVLRLCLCGRLTAEQVGHGFHRVLQ